MTVRPLFLSLLPFIKTKGSEMNTDLSGTFALSHWTKFQTLSPTERRTTCTLCRHPLNLTDLHSFALCPLSDCSAFAHLTCLATHFLSTDEPGRVVPLEGTCPACERAVEWGLVARGLEAIVRGFEGEFDPKKRGRKGKKGRVVDEEGEGGEGVTGSEEGLTTTTTEDTQSEEEVLRADKGKGKVRSFLL